MAAAHSTTWFDRLHAVLVAVVCLSLSCSAVGCEDSERRRTTLFEEAEQHYRRGEYEAALDDYQVFLERYPRSRLAETARLRKWNINREIQSMMSRDDMPSPTYTGNEPTRDRSAVFSTEGKTDSSEERDAGDDT